MRNNFRKFVINCLLILVFLLNAGTVAAAQSITDQANSGLQTAVDEAYGGGEKVTIGPDTFAGFLISIINSLLTFVGILFFILIIYAGYLWMTARGNEEQVSKAKKITREAVVGLLIIILARLLTEFLLTQIGTATQ